MFEELFDKLDRSYDNTKAFMKAGKLFDAYESVKARNEKEAKFLTGIILILMKKNKKGLEIVNIMIDTGSALLGKDIMYEVIGTLYYNEGNYLEAARYFTESLKENPKNINSLYNITTIYIVKKDYLKAFENLDKLIRVIPNDEMVKRNYKLVKERLNIK